MTNKHINSAHAGVTFKCNICETTLKWKGSLTKHIKSINVRYVIIKQH